jgi:hypothetical protein
MTTEHKYSTWSSVVAQADDGPPLTFLIMSKSSFSAHAQCYTDDPDAVHVFMLGKRLRDYKLYVNDRLYDWPKEPRTLLEHLIYCRDMDNTLYPADEFPREHWWV